MLVFGRVKLVDHSRSYDEMIKSRFTLFLLQFSKPTITYVTPLYDLYQSCTEVRLQQMKTTRNYQKVKSILGTSHQIVAINC